MSCYVYAYVKNFKFAEPAYCGRIQCDAGATDCSSSYDHVFVHPTPKVRPKKPSSYNSENLRFPQRTLKAGN